MILRVYAMWNRSKWILYILLFIYVPQVIAPIVEQAIYANPNTFLSGMSQAKLQAKHKSHAWPHALPPCSLVTVVQVTIDVAFCNISDEPSLTWSNALLQLLWGLTAFRLVLGVMLLILAVISTLKDSVVMYKATKQWQPNHYMQLLTKDGILYFLVYVSPFPFVPFFSPPILLSSTCEKLTILNI